MNERTPDTTAAASAAAQPFYADEPQRAPAQPSTSEPLTEHELLDKAVFTLVFALAFDSAFQAGAPADELQHMRGHWVPDAERIVDEAERMGFLDDGMDDDDDFDDTEEDFDG